MALKVPENADECIYWTNRYIGENGSVKCWVLRKKCGKCELGMIGKPVDPKTGKVKTRASAYVCNECGHAVGKEEYEEQLTANITYTCPKCGNDGELQVPFRRKKIQTVNASGKKQSVDALQFSCGACGEKINITKKMK